MLSGSRVGGCFEDGLAPLFMAPSRSALMTRPATKSKREPKGSLETSWERGVRCPLALRPEGTRAFVHVHTSGCEGGASGSIFSRDEHGKEGNPLPPRLKTDRGSPHGGSFFRRAPEAKS